MKRIILIAAVFFAIGAAVGVSGYYMDHKAGNFTAPESVHVYPGTSPEEAVGLLLEAGAVKRPGSLRRAFRSVICDGEVQPGYYVFSPSSSSFYAARALKFGWQTPVTMTLSGTIRTKETLAKKLSRNMLVDSLDIINALRDNKFLSAYGFDTVSVFSLVIPDSYEMKWTSSVDEIFARLKKEYDAFWTPENVRKASALGLDPRRASILASIVDGESHNAKELPLIAGVYLNRLAIGMRLQADPTVAFCFGYRLKRILRRHTEYDSPYNTYVYAGLPPGPISVPPKACLEAVLNPGRHNYYYFCASPAMDGTHVFASDYAEHCRNAKAFQKALDERLRNNN